MSDLTDRIDAFLTRYPDGCVLEFAGREKKTAARTALEVMATDLTTAAARAAITEGDRP